MRGRRGQPSSWRQNVGEEGAGKQRGGKPAPLAFQATKGVGRQRGGGQKTRSARISSDWGVGRQREVVTSSPCVSNNRGVLAGRANLPKWGRGFSVVMGIS